MNRSRLRGFVVTWLGLLACHRPPPDCEFDSVERCLWERGVAPPDPSDAGGPSIESAGNGEGQPVGEAEPFERWLALAATIDELAVLIGSGLEWALIDERARELCGSPPELRETLDGPPAWVCSPAAALEIDGNQLRLEVGEGVVSLTAEGLTERVSGKLVALALDTIGEACQGDFHSVEGPVNQEFSMCALRSGPVLYVGRFPQDLDADRWQVSIAVVDAG